LRRLFRVALLVHVCRRRALRAYAKKTERMRRRQNGTNLTIIVEVRAWLQVRRSNGSPRTAASTPHGAMAGSDEFSYYASCAGKRSRRRICTPYRVGALARQALCSLGWCSTRALCVCVAWCDDDARSVARGARGSESETERETGGVRREFSLGSGGRLHYTRRLLTTTDIGRSNDETRGYERARRHPRFA
jgi:hypothetical protein